MAAYLFICYACRRQIPKVYHHVQEVPPTVPCPGCGKQVSRGPVQVEKTKDCVPEMVMSPSGVLKPKVAKGRKG